MKDGILILNKPQDWTSHDCVAVCRRVTGVKKVGHGGTLDPMAEGLLPVFIGKATKIMEYLDLDYKTYRCTAKLGITTDTQDVWGEVLEEKSPAGVTESEIMEKLQAFDTEKVFIAGGANVYEQFMDDCDEFYVTKIDEEYEADRFFPDLDAKGLHVTWESEPQQEKGISYRFTIYSR